MNFQSHANYIGFYSYFVRFDFPREFVNCIPDKLMFICFAYDNSEKRIKIYQNFKLTIDKQINKAMKDFKISKDFLQKLQFGKASTFAGELYEPTFGQQF